MNDASQALNLDLFDFELQILAIKGDVEFLKKALLTQDSVFQFVTESDVRVKAGESRDRYVDLMEVRSHWLCRDPFDFLIRARFYVDSY